MKITIPMNNQTKTQEAVFNMLAPVSGDINWPIEFEIKVSSKFIKRNPLMSRRMGFSCGDVEKWGNSQHRMHMKMLNW